MLPCSLAFSIRRNVDSAVTVLPEADSPTSASFSPASSLNDARSTTRRAPKLIERSLTSSRLIGVLAPCKGGREPQASGGFGFFSRPLLLQNLSRVQSVSQCVSDQYQQEQHHHQHAEGGE